ncbi:MAG: hypothetical protein JO167_10170, partial [Alphaproteobacteria bacterium]|nr:hypothetical protein [Alphaproteobacteria bacterium]
MRSLFSSVKSGYTDFMNAPIQARAQLSEDLLLDAAETLLRKGGEDACTMPEVAEQAR